MKLTYQQVLEKGRRVIPVDGVAQMVKDLEACLNLLAHQRETFEEASHRKSALGQIAQTHLKETVERIGRLEEFRCALLNAEAQRREDAKARPAKKFYGITPQQWVARHRGEMVDGMGKYSAGVSFFMEVCFGLEIANDKAERSFRFLEESLELCQACGVKSEEVLTLFNYVYERPVGEMKQEVGGVMVTLAALCLAQKIEMGECALAELERVFGKIEKIRAKHASKPVGVRTALPGSYPLGAQEEPGQELTQGGEDQSKGGFRFTALEAFEAYGKVVGE